MPDIRTTPILDDFQRADENPLSNGGKWSFSGLSGSGNLKLVTHTAKASTSGDMYWNVQTFDDEVIEVWGIAVGGGAGGIAWALDMYRVTGIGTTGVDGYRARQEASGANAGSTQLYRITNSGATNIAHGTLPGLVNGEGLLYRYTKATATHDLYYAMSPYTTWNHAISKVDATWVPPFYIGLGVRDNSGGGILGWTQYGGGVPIAFVPQIILRPRAWK